MSTATDERVDLDTEVPCLLNGQPGHVNEPATCLVSSTCPHCSLVGPWNPQGAVCRAVVLQMIAMYVVGICSGCRKPIHLADAIRWRPL